MSNGIANFGIYAAAFATTLIVGTFGAGKLAQPIFGTGPVFGTTQFGYGIVATSMFVLFMAVWFGTAGLRARKLGESS